MMPTPYNPIVTMIPRPSEGQKSHPFLRSMGITANNASEGSTRYKMLSAYAAMSSELTPSRWSIIIEKILDNGSEIITAPKTIDRFANSLAPTIIPPLNRPFTNNSTQVMWGYEGARTESMLSEGIFTAKRHDVQFCL